MIDRAIDALTRALGWWKRHRRYRIREEPAKVNLGGGLTEVPGWINVDIGLYATLARLPRPWLRRLYRQSAWRDSLPQDDFIRILKMGKFIQHDLSHGLPFHDDAVDYLFASHLLDVLTRAAGEKLLGEAFRVLRPGGLLRLVASDFACNLALYAAGRREEVLLRFFPTTSSRANLRYFMYDFETLAAALSRAGFVNVRRCQYQEGELPDAELLDTRPGESLFVEARKPLTR